MANYRISYKDFPGVEFKSQKAVRAYLNGEEKAWSAMPEPPQGRSVTLNVRGPNNSQLSLSQIVAAIAELRNFIEDVERFNEKADGNHRTLALPPPSASPEGSAILGLFGNHRSAIAINVLEAFWLTADPCR